MHPLEPTLSAKIVANYAHDVIKMVHLFTIGYKDYFTDYQYFVITGLIYHNIHDSKNYSPDEFYDAILSSNFTLIWAYYKAIRKHVYVFNQHPMPIKNRIDNIFNDFISSMNLANGTF